jgi:hypothetical protein
MKIAPHDAVVRAVDTLPNRHRARARERTAATVECAHRVTDESHLRIGTERPIHAQRMGHHLGGAAPGDRARCAVAERVDHDAIGAALSRLPTEREHGLFGGEATMGRDQERRSANVARQNDRSDLPSLDGECRCAPKLDSEQGKAGSGSEPANEEDRGDEARGRASSRDRLDQRFFCRAMTAWMPSQLTPGTTP